jgi:hypothetical protein
MSPRIEFEEKLVNNSQEFNGIGDGFGIAEGLALSGLAVGCNRALFEQKPKETIAIEETIKTIAKNDKEKPKKNQENQTLADKLKQSLSQPETIEAPKAPLPKPNPIKPQARVVVKQVEPPPKLPQDKTRSLMIRGLYRGLKNDDLIKYFSKFGSVHGITSPPCVNYMDDGVKYAFMKFNEYESVEKAMGKKCGTIVAYMSVSNGVLACLLLCYVGCDLLVSTREDSTSGIFSVSTLSVPQFSISSTAYPMHTVKGIKLITKKAKDFD